MSSRDGAVMGLNHKQYQPITFLVNYVSTHFEARILSKLL